jgi:hypothetical protein
MIFLQTKTVNAISPLHIEGRWIKNETGDTIVLRGINKHGFEDHPNGHWQTPNGGVDWNTFNPTVVAANLDAMKSWGINCVRSYYTTQFWIENTGNHRQIVKDYATMLSERDMYLIYSMYHDTPGDQTYFPSDETAFVNMWGSIADELKDYPNVIFEFWNEPNLGDGMSGVDRWQRVWQDCIDAVRATGAENLISVHFKGSIWINIVYGNGDTLSYVETNPLNDPLGNLFYSPHNYRTYYQFQCPGGVKCWEYDDLKLAMQMCEVEHVLNDLQIPVILGEVGPNMWESGEELQHELEYYENLLKICNEWGMGYTTFLWFHSGFPFIHLTTQPNYQPNSAGEILINAIAEGSGETTTTTTIISTTTTITSTTTSTTTTISPVTISGQLQNETSTIEANISIFNQGTDQINISQITSGGNYILNVWPDVYDLEYNILDFFIQNFWIKLISLSINSNLQDVVNGVTGYSGKNITFTVNITTDQEIQVYSDDKPRTVKVNGIELTEGTLLLSPNEWYYDSDNQRLRMIVSPTTTTTTVATTTIPTTTTTIGTTTTTPVTSTTTIPETTTTTIPGTEKTFGKTDVGDSSYTGSEDRIYLYKATLTENGDVTKISVYGQLSSSGSGVMQCAIYDDDSGEPHALIGVSVEVTIDNTLQWWNFTFDPAVFLTAADYWIGWNQGDYISFRYYFDSVSDTSRWLGNQEYNDGFPNPIGSMNHLDKQISIFATYTPS